VRFPTGQSLRLLFQPRSQRLSATIRRKTAPAHDNASRRSTESAAVAIARAARGHGSGVPRRLTVPTDPTKLGLAQYLDVWLDVAPPVHGRGFVVLEESSVAAMVIFGFGSGTLVLRVVPSQTGRDVRRCPAPPVHGRGFVVHGAFLVRTLDQASGPTPILLWKPQSGSVCPHHRSDVAPPPGGVRRSGATPPWAEQAEPQRSRARVWSTMPAAPLPNSLALVSQQRKTSERVRYSNRAQISSLRC
jgi:hypothetical protein